MEKRRLGPLIVRLLPIANVGLWVLFPPVDDGRGDQVRQVIGEMLASTTVVLLGLALLLSTRARFLEPFFGGLDKMYRAHKDASVAGFMLLVLHVAVIPWDLEPGGGVPAGLIAFAGFTILVLLTLGPRLPATRRIVRLGYRSWKRSHWLMGLFFVFSLAHMFLVRPLITTTVLPLSLVLTAFVVGIASYLYLLFAARFVRPIRSYAVERVHRLNETTVELALRPRKQALAFRAGQFVFVRFNGRVLREGHPFTVASSPREDLLRLLIRASGDFTRYLYENIESGRKAKVEGSYGLLDYRRGGPDQTWIAGGIGITPFLSWLRDLEELDRRIDFFYAVRGPGDALFVEEIEAIAARHPELAFHLNVSARDGSLTIDRIESLSRGPLREKTVYMCGPVGMIKSLEQAFRAHGVPVGAIHYEEFSFR